MNNPRIGDYLEYRDGDLFWKVDHCHIVSGQRAGSMAPNGRRYVSFFGKKHLVHRVIWYLHHGSVPDFLDHIDGNPLNNRIENLRQATKQQNAMNRRIRSDNSTGFKGIYPAGKKFKASICVSGQNIYLGTFDTKEAAHSAYRAAAQERFKEFAHV